MLNIPSLLVTLQMSHTMCIYLLPHKYDAVRSFCLRSIENSKVCFSRQYRQVIYVRSGLSLVDLENLSSICFSSVCTLPQVKLLTVFVREEDWMVSPRQRYGMSRTTGSDRDWHQYPRMRFSAAVRKVKLAIFFH